MQPLKNGSYLDYDHELLNTVISHAPNQSLLIPGVGAQGGSVDELKESLKNHKGIPIINSSRGIIYAGKGMDWANSVRKAAETTKIAIQDITDRYLD